MEKRKLILLAVVIVLGVLLTAKMMLKNDNELVVKNDQSKIKIEYEKLKESDKPSIIFFSYDADCCENTKRFFDGYNDKARNLINSYQGKLNTMFINTGALTEKEEDEMLEIARVNQVERLPSLLILDSKGKAFKVIVGLFDEQEIKTTLEGMVK